MTDCIVDTNVPIVANRGHQDVSPECVLACVEAIANLRNDTILIDDQWLIIREYLQHLESSGQPGPGDAFLKHVLNNQANPNRVRQVPITSKDANNTDFEEIPESEVFEEFDPSDKKFIAVSFASEHCAEILQATDSKWFLLRNGLESEGIKVKFLCPDDIERFSRNRG